VLSAQQSSASTPQKQPSYAAIPVEAAKQPNPVKSSPESVARAKKWWTLDLCHVPWQGWRRKRRDRHGNET